MVKKDKVFELTIEDDDEVSGVDSISLVDDPAIEINWVAFKKEEELVAEGDFGKAEPIKINGVGIFEHGEDMHNYSDLETGTQPTYLTKKGKKYAEQMGEWVFENGKDKLIHSGIKRAEDTANIAADKANELHGKDKVKSEPNPLLKTLDIGNYNGKKRGAFVEEYWLKNKDKKIPSGETFQNFIDRMEKCYKFVEGAAMNHQMVSHSKVIRALRAIHDSKGVWDDKASQAFLDSRKNDETFDYNVGTIGGYVDPGIGKKKKKKMEEKKKPLTPSVPEIAGPPSEFDYLKPSAHSKQAFATDEDKQIVLGPAMVPDMKIFRKDPQGNPYYVFFSAETIFQISQKYLKNKYIDNNDMMHDGVALKDVYVIESWIKESDNDKSTDYGFKDLPVGTWFVSLKINNPDIWSKIKSHQLNGFSVSGYFAEEPANFVSNEEMFLYAIADIIKSSEK